MKSCGVGRIGSRDRSPRGERRSNDALPHITLGFEMGIFDLFRKKPWALEPLTPPWQPLPSIHDDIAAQLAANVDAKTDAGLTSLPATYTLPDDDAVHPEGGIRWAAGALDGVMGHHGGGADEAQLRVRQLCKAIEDLLQTSSDENLRRLYDLTISAGVLGIVDDMVQTLVAQRDRLDAERFHALASYLARRGGHREAVKLGIALLGMLTTADDHATLTTLGTCDEFTLFVAVALNNQAPNQDAGHRQLFDLAQRVHGWGRVQLVERLVETKDPEIRAWLLRDGFRNGVMYEYLACICARAGELAKALANPELDDALLLSAAELLSALVSGQGGPAEGLDDYEDASRAVGSYLGQLIARRPENVQHLLTTASLRDYLQQADGWEARAAHAWTEPHRQRCLAIAEEVLAWPEWRDLTLKAQASDDKVVAWAGDAGAKILGIDSWEHHLRNVERDGAGSTSWFRLFEETNASRIDAVLSMAERVLPLAAIGVGAADQMGMGKEFVAHGGLEAVVQGLANYPGKGVRFIETALRSPVTRNRFGALRTLSAWGAERWPAGVVSMLEAAEGVEPVERVREAIGRVLRGELMG